MNDFMTQQIFRNSAIFLLAIFSLITFAPVVSAYVSPGSPKGYVNDYADILSVSEKSDLEQQLVAFEKTSAVQIAVVTVKNLSGDYIENYAAQLFKEWGVGGKEKDSGVLFLVAVEDRKVRLEVGYGLEGALTDGEAGAIIRNEITPFFKQGKYFEGITNGVHGVMSATQGEYAGDTTTTSSPSIPGFFNNFPIILFFGFMFLQFLASILGRSKSWWLGGVLGASVGGAMIYFDFLALPLFFSILITAFLTVCGLVFDYVVSSTHARAQASGASSPWWVGGGGGSSSGGSSFGGFSGGSSGGGGASGSW